MGTVTSLVHTHGQGSKSRNHVNTGTAWGPRGGIDERPQMHKNLGLCFDNESKGYLLNASLHAALCLTPV